MIWILLSLLISLVINYLIAGEMRNIATLKGYRDVDRYFWFCFWLGLPGWLMVVALPVQSRTAGNECETPITRTPQLAPQTPSVPRSEPVKSPAPAVPAKEVKPAEPVRVTEQDGQIQCPSCGLWQKANRSLCWKCGTRFQQENS